jgi:predicted DNA-binding transcriptional regulator YafY
MNSTPIISFKIRYVGLDGPPADRIIDLMKFTNVGQYHIYAFCHLRNEFRTFNYAGIQQCIALSTGEEITDLYAYLRKLYQQLHGKTAKFKIFPTQK